MKEQLIIDEKYVFRKEIQAPSDESSFIIKNMTLHVIKVRRMTVENDK